MRRGLLSSTIQMSPDLFSQALLVRQQSQLCFCARADRFTPSSLGWAMFTLDQASGG